jgi:signal transduction histidine kinase
VQAVPQPFLTVTTVEAIIIGALALMFASVAWRTREAGLRTLAAGFALAAAWYFASDQIPYTGPLIDTLPQRLGSLVIGMGVLLVAVGVVRYLGWPGGLLQAAVVVFLLPALLLLGALAVGVDVPHRVFHFGVMLAYVGAAVVALGRARNEPGTGHLALGLALLTLAGLPLAMSAFGVEPEQLRYLAGAARAVFGVFLLTVILLRRHQALKDEISLRADAEARLRDANGRLEARVGERTAHLHELINGLEDFSRGVSHDLRGPLGGMAQLAQHAAEAMSRGDRALAERALPAIAQQCEASARMVSAMLELARLGDTTVRREWVAVDELARAAFDEVMLSNPGRERPALRCAGLPRVLADADLLRAVFVNLLANAVKFTRDTPQAQIDIEASVEGRDVTLCVRDNGAGFAPEAARRLFEPFFRAHGARYEGHGLGLSIVRRAVEAQGGHAWAEAGAPGGARLCFRLDGAAPAPAAAPAVAAAALADTAP